MDVYRKPTHTDRYLDFNSHHDKKHKESTATLIHRALNLPNTSEGIERELNHVYAALESNGYPSKFIHDLQTKKTRPPPNLSPEELVGMFFKPRFEPRRYMYRLLTCPCTFPLHHAESVGNQCAKKELYFRSSNCRST